MAGPPLNPDTIAAIATPPGAGGVGIVRLSGPLAPRLLSALFRPERAPEEFESHRLYPGRVADPATGEVVDQVLAVRMRAPRSYTGEEAAEIQAHGSDLALRRILALCISRGAREARPGEFTERAFLNGKMDLSQAEAVADLIHARTEDARRSALEMLGGALSEKAREAARQLRRVLAHVELDVDFSETEEAEAPPGEVLRDLESARAGLENLLAGYRRGKLLREGARVTLLGAPNAGKSSLFNALLEEERALVHPEPGTTRDRIEEWLDVGGIPARLSDTAGLRAAGGVEAQGVELARRAAAEADLLLLVSDASGPLPEEGQNLLDLHGERVLWIASKMDLPGARAAPEALPVSAKTGQGLLELRRQMAARLGGTDAGGGVALSRERHRRAVAGALAHLENAAGLLESEKGAGGRPELAASALRQALAELSEIAGETTSEDVLALIFSEFCIGK